MINHQMQAVYNGATITWTCPVCGRVVETNAELGTRLTLVEGNAGVSHSGGDLTISDEIELIDPYLEPFEDWISKR